VLRQHGLVKALLSSSDSRRASVHTDLRLGKLNWCFR
jgi:hypothetical protein